MRHHICVTALVLVMCASAAHGFGFMGGPGPGIGLGFTPVVGAWAEYKTTSAGEESATIRFAIVGQEGDAFWYEMATAMGDEGEVITKMLVEGDPLDQPRILRMIIKGGGEPAMELPVDTLLAGADEEQPMPETALTELGVETVTVPAGTFKTRHVGAAQDGDATGEMWLASEVGPYQVVRLVAENMEMVLVAHGDGAASRITETPVKFEIPVFPVDLPEEGE
ncbi:MAG: hypothetical protein FJY74_05190 [Candidatus Eisenbacteria bacterium]|nr:hypothetical protein [Candidatus Eisenbacteria bacterium]